MTNSASTMIQGWPDALRCGVDSGSGAGSFSLLHQAADYIWYCQINAGEERCVKFSQAGDYSDYLGHYGTSAGCINKSIVNLYTEGRAFNFVSSKIKDVSGASTMVLGFPDALRCGVDSGSGAGSFSLLHQAADYIWYCQINAGEERCVKFSQAGDYSDYLGHYGTSAGCINKSIVNLYTAGRAFNFVTSKVADSTATSPVGNSCLILKALILGSIGDIDRNNEEIEFEIKSGDTQLNCGLFLFDIVKNVKDKNLNIKIPCVKGEFVDVRVIERDVCNDDMTLESIKCESTEGLLRLEIKISADATSTSYTQCTIASKEVQGCVDASVGEVIQVGGEFCYAYEWGKEECGATQVSETASEYVLEYEVSEGECNFDWSELSEEEYCGYHQYYPGPVCDANIDVDAGLGAEHYIASFAFLWV